MLDFAIGDAELLEYIETEVTRAGGEITRD
jgi:hypothetical protein